MSADLEKAASLILSAINEDPSREGLQRTPQRFAKAIREITSGYTRTPEQVVGEGVFSSPSSEPVMVARMKYYSMCEHHLLPFYGECSVAYVPDGKIIGLSKIPKLVDLFSQRLQVQELLTTQIGEALEKAVAPKGVAILMSGTHLCSVMRNLKDHDAPMITMHRSGCYRSDDVLFETFRKIAFQE